MVILRPPCYKCGRPAEKSYNKGKQTGWKSSCYLCRRKKSPTFKNFYSYPLSYFDKFADSKGENKRKKTNEKNRANKRNNRSKKNARRRNKLFKILGSICVRCGFIPENKCQIDFDHIDGNHKNNAISNIQPLCANCHRVKSIVLTEDYLGPNRKTQTTKELIDTVRWCKTAVVV